MSKPLRKLCCTVIGDKGQEVFIFFQEAEEEGEGHYAVEESIVTDVSQKPKEFRTLSIHTAIYHAVELLQIKK